MKWIFKLGFLVGLSTIFVRYYIRADAQTHYWDFAESGKWELAYYLLAYAWVCLSLWEKHFRSRCPKCKSTNILLQSKEVVKRWDKASQEEQNIGTTGRPEYQYVDVIVKMVRKRFSSECKVCKHNWTVENDAQEN